MVVAVAALAPLPVRAQDSIGTLATQRAELVRSIGQPPLWRPFVSTGIAHDRARGERTLGAAAVGVERPIGNPVSGALAASGEIYARARSGERDAGARLLAVSSLFLLQGGVDWNERLGRVDLIVGTTFPLRRGGWPVPGSQFRAHWIPARQHSIEAGLVIPVMQPYAGRTRPRQVAARLPAGEPVVVTLPESGGVRLAWRETRASMTQLVSLLTFFWLIEDRNISYAASVREWRDVLADFGAEFFPRGARSAGQSQYRREAEAYHSSLERTFALAAAATSTDPRLGRTLADSARQIALREIVLPYNRSYGRYRLPDSVLGFRTVARARFESGLGGVPGLDAAAAARVLAVFDVWSGELEQLRRRIGEIAGDRRLNWLPVGLVLRPEEHRTQSQIDALVELALDRTIDEGNTAYSIDAPLFQHELKRTIHETRDSHVLWVHDYRGVDELGDPDRTSFDITLAYLRALRDAVQRYDSAGRFPTWLILVDQHFWEVTRGRLWMNLLERPLTHQLRLKPQFAYMQSAVVAMQDSLRTAVAGSARLQAEAARYGRGWIPGVVKVHVNVSNPVDYSFRTRHIAMPLGSDNLLRDHRKMILRDPDESDPASGEVVFAGVGVGDHYASATWDDRAMIVRGPAVASTLPYLRATLERHTLRGSAMPPVFRKQQDAGFSAAQIRGLQAAGATARVLQTHNEVAWGSKESSFVQMLLYDLAPEGTLIFVPDALWSSYQWMAQLVGAALRGCHVYIVAPAKANAPAAGFPWMSAQQELVTRAMLVEEVLGDVIRAGGGDLRVGLYARTTPLDDYAASLESVLDSWRQQAFLREAIPLSADALATLAHEADAIRRQPVPLSIVADARSRLPLLHRKTQWLIGSGALRSLATSPAMPRALEASLAVPRFAGTDGSGGDHDQVRLAAVQSLLAMHAGLEGAAADAPLYFTTGSMNKNPRSMMVDGEVLGLVAGPWALEPMLDLLVLIGTTTWVNSLADVERLLPPYSRQQRRLGRWLYPII